MNAKSYRELAQAKRAAEKLHDVELPSGCVWKMRTPPIEQFIAAGKLPASLAAKMASLAKKTAGKTLDKAAEQEILKHLTPEESLANIAFGRDLLMFCAVEPEISLSPDPENENQIAPEEILGEDFVFLINWVMTGGRSGASLESFRDKSPELTLVSSNSETVRETPV